MEISPINTFQTQPQTQVPTDYYKWWQRDDLCYQNDSLIFAGQKVTDLAGRFGSPAFVYSLARVRANLERLHGALELAGFAGRYKILYAMKANRFAPLLSHLKAFGLCGIDACSPQEVELAVSCGFKPSEISFTAGSLSANDMTMLSRFDGLVMDCDSIHAIRAWGKYRPGSAIGIRINPALGVSRENNSALQYAGGVTTKFGVYREQFQEALDAAKDAGLKVNKIHFHTGCGYLTPQLGQWDRVIEACQWFLDQCPDLRTVNVGGGLGVPHTAEDGTLDLVQWGNILKKHFGGRDIQLEIEPGEYVMKDAGILLLGKTYLEKKKNTWFLGLDAGFNIAPEPAYYKLPFQPLPLTLDGSALTPLQVVGNINEALDVWFQDAWLPAMDDQQYLAFINAGAYSSSMASNHCMRGQFREFLIA